MTDRRIRPFTELPQPIRTEGTLGELVGDIATGVEVAAVVIPVPDVGPMPGLLLSFTTPEGKPGPRIALVAEPDELEALGAVITYAIESANRHAREAGR